MVGCLLRWVLSVLTAVYSSGYLYLGGWFFGFGYLGFLVFVFIVLSVMFVFLMNREYIG